MNRHTAIYARLSPRPDGSYEGVDIQEAQGRKYAAGTWPGVPVVVYADKGISAANGDHRPAYEALRAAVRSGEVAHIWAVEQSRLERREVGWFQLAAELDAAGITEVHTGRDGIVRVGDEIAGIKAVLNASEVRKLKLRVKDRLDANAANGTPAGSTSYGLRHVTVDGVKTYAVDPDQAAALQWAAGRALAGWSLSSIAAALREGSWPEDGTVQPMTGNHMVKVAGSVTRRPGILTAASVRRMLTAPAVAGFRVHRGVIVGSGNWPAILDESTWRAVRSKLSSPRTVKRPDGTDYPIGEASARLAAGRKYTLTGGLAVCGVCGSPMLAQFAQVKRGTNRAIYRCSRPGSAGRKGACVSVKADDFESYVTDELFSALAMTDLADRIAADDHAGRREEIGTQLATIDGQRRDLAAMWAAGDLNTQEWKTARDTLAATERELNTELASKPQPPARVAIGTARESWVSMDLGEQREFIRLFVDRVSVGRATPGLQRFDSSRVEIMWRD